LNATVDLPLRSRLSIHATLMRVERRRYGQPDDHGRHATLKKARLRALEEDTSVNAVLREYLQEYAGRRREQVEARNIVAASRESVSGSGPDGHGWKR
jgi:hypothetical protein